MNIPVYMAPLAGYTDLPYRELVREFHPAGSTTEMVSMRALYYGDKKTKKMLKTSEDDRNTALQIFGDDPKMIEFCISEYLNPLEGFASFDINMGCPAPKIVKSGAGSALLKEPSKAYDIMVRAVRAANRPVTVKLRKGFDRDEEGLTVAKMAEDAGISSVTVHGRTRAMYYSGVADWDFIKKVKQELSIPVIGNGDITGYDDGLGKVRYSKVDGIAIGRGAIGNPWIFEEFYRKGRGEPYHPPTIRERMETAARHVRKACEYYGEYRGIREMRKHLMGYTRGLPDSARLRKLINEQTEESALLSVLSDYGREEHRESE